MGNPSSFPHNRAAHILSFLEAAGDWRSGEDISRLLGISRAAVSKHIIALRREGHAIAAATRRGYKLLVKHERLDPGDLVTGLQSRVLGKQGWTVFAETTSTSHEAVRQAMEGMPEGRIILAEHQTQGRGRKGHSWFSAPRGLQFSVILRPDPCIWDAEALTRLGVLAVAQSLAERGFRPELKLPNDVLLEGRKVAGVLLESGFRANEPEWAVLGIGCNVNALSEEFPEELRRVTTSLLDFSGVRHDRPALLRSILQHLEDGYDDLRRGELDAAALRTHFSR